MLNVSFCMTSVCTIGLIQNKQAKKRKTFCPVFVVASSALVMVSLDLHTIYVWPFQAVTLLFNSKGSKTVLKCTVYEISYVHLLEPKQSIKHLKLGAKLTVHSCCNFQNECEHCLFSAYVCGDCLRKSTVPLL